MLALLILVPLVLAVTLTAQTVFLMLMLDFASNLDGRVPDFGFGTCFLLIALFNIMSAMRSGTAEATSNVR